MARSDHPRYTAADRYERRQSRRPRDIERRLRTRQSVIAAELEVSR